MDLIHINFKSERHDQYKDYQNIFNNYEDEWLMLRQFKSKINHPYLAIALPREIVTLYSDMAFSTPVNAFAENKETDNALDDIIENNNLDMMLSEASLTQAIKGGVVFKNYLDHGESKISFIEPDYYFPKFSPTDKRKLISETIAYPFTEDRKQYLYTETYEPRNGEYWCITSIYVFQNEKIGAEISRNEVNTKLTHSSPLTYIPFVRSGNSFWGESLYKGLTPLFDELNHRVTQIADVLDRHSDPNMYADPSFFEDNGEFQSGGKAYPVDHSNGEKPPGYITFDWSAEWNFKFIDEIIFKALHYVSPLAPSLYGLDTASQASGRSLLIKSWRTQCMVKRSHMYWRAALKKILYVAQQLEIISGKASYKPEVANVEITLNIPTDFYEMAQAEQLKVQSGLSSKKSAIARLNPHMDSKEVEEEFLEIINEQNEVNKQNFIDDKW